MSGQEVKRIVWCVLHKNVSEPIKYLHCYIQALVHENFALRRHIHESEAAAHCQVDRRYTAIGGVHGSQHVKVLWHREQIASVYRMGKFNLPNITTPISPGSNR